MTSEIARASARVAGGANDLPGDDPDWRISIADVATGGPFSSFPGVDRVIVRIGHGAMVLTIDGVEHDLVRFSPLGFAGEAETMARVPEGATKDLNVMTRRGRARAAVRVCEVDGGPRVTAARDSELVLIVLEGAIRFDSPTGAVRLGVHDAFRLPGPVDLELGGRGRVAVVVIEPSPSSAVA